MRFFDSEIVREELSEINRLQTSIYGKMFGFGFLSPTDRKEHVEKLETLLEKQKTMWTRLSLSDDPEAKQMKDKICPRTPSNQGFRRNDYVQTCF